MNERLFEILMIVFGLVGLLILFTVLFAGPGYILKNVLGILQPS